MYRGGHGFARPENALKRSEELVGVGQRRAALQALHDVVTSRRHRSWTPASEAVMKRYCELCIELRTPRMVKDGLISYKNSTLNVRRPGPPAASSRPPRAAGPPGRAWAPRRPSPGVPRGAPGPLPARSRGAQAIPGPRRRRRRRRFFILRSSAAGSPRLGAEPREPGGGGGGGLCAVPPVPGALPCPPPPLPPGSYRELELTKGMPDP